MLSHLILSHLKRMIIFVTRGKNQTFGLYEVVLASATKDRHRHRQLSLFLWIIKWLVNNIQHSQNVTCKPGTKQRPLIFQVYTEIYICNFILYRPTHSPTLHVINDIGPTIAVIRYRKTGECAEHAFITTSLPTNQIEDNKDLSVSNSVVYTLDANCKHVHINTHANRKQEKHNTQLQTRAQRYTLTWLYRISTSSHQSSSYHIKTWQLTTSAD